MSEEQNIYTRHDNRHRLACRPDERMGPGYPKNMIIKLIIPYILTAGNNVICMMQM